MLEGFDRCARVEYSACHFPKIPDLGKVAVQVGTGLNLDTDDVSPGFGEVLNVFFRLDDHQVNIKRLCGHRAKGFHDHRSDRDVGHEAAIHHIHVDPVSTGLINSLDVFTQPREVGGKNRG